MAKKSKPPTPIVPSATEPSASEMLQICNLVSRGMKLKAAREKVLGKPGKEVETEAGEDLL